MNSTWHYSVSIGYRMKCFLKAVFYILALNAVSKIFSGEVLYAGNYFMLMLMGIVLVIKYAYQVELKNDCIKTRYGVITSQFFNLTRVVKYSESPTSITLFYADDARFTIWIKRLPTSATQKIKEQLKLKKIPFEQPSAIEPLANMELSLITDQSPKECGEAVVDKQLNKRVGRKLQKALIFVGVILVLISILVLVSNRISIPLEQGLIYPDIDESTFHMIWTICSVLGSLSASLGFYLVIKNSDNA